MRKIINSTYISLDGFGETGDLLFGAAPATGFELADATTLSDGIVILGYRTGERL